MTTATCPSNKQFQSQSLPEIKVNGVLIDQNELAEELQYHPNESFDDVVYQSARALIVRQLLREQIAGLPLSDSDIDSTGGSNSGNTTGTDGNVDEESLIAELIEKHAQVEQPSEQDCERYFKQNRDKFAGAPILEVDHILLAAAPDDIEQRDKQRKKAIELIAEIKNQPQLFTDFVARYSACPSKNTGGSLGQISKGQTVAEFENAIMHLHPGLVEKPIESRYGFHIAWIHRRIEGKPQTLEMVKPKIAQYLFHRQKNLAIQRFIYGLLESATIEGIEISFDDENIYH